MAYRTNHQGCSHEGTPGARRACRARFFTALRAAQHAYVVADSDSGWNAYDELVHGFALIANMDVPAAYRFIEETEI